MRFSSPDCRYSHGVCEALKNVARQIGWPVRSICLAELVFHVGMRNSTFINKLGVNEDGSPAASKSSAPMFLLSPVDCACSCLFVAAKLTDTPKRMRDILVAAISYMRPGSDTTINTESEKFERWKLRMIVFESKLLLAISMQFREVPPFEFLVQFSKTCGALKDQCQRAWLQMYDMYSCPVVCSCSHRLLVLISFFISDEIYQNSDSRIKPRLPQVLQRFIALYRHQVRALSIKFLEFMIAITDVTKPLYEVLRTIKISLNKEQEAYQRNQVEKKADREQLLVSGSAKAIGRQNSTSRLEEASSFEKAGNWRTTQASQSSENAAKYITTPNNNYTLAKAAKEKNICDSLTGLRYSTGKDSGALSYADSKNTRESSSFSSHVNNTKKPSSSIHKYHNAVDSKNNGHGNESSGLHYRSRRVSDSPITFKDDATNSRGLRYRNQSQKFKYHHGSRANEPDEVRRNSGENRKRGIADKNCSNERSCSDTQQKSGNLGNAAQKCDSVSAFWAKSGSRVSASAAQQQNSKPADLASAAAAKVWNAKSKDTDYSRDTGGNNSLPSYSCSRSPSQSERVLRTQWNESPAREINRGHTSIRERVKSESPKRNPRSHHDDAPENQKAHRALSPSPSRSTSRSTSRTCSSIKNSAMPSINNSRSPSPVKTNRKASDKSKGNSSSSEEKKDGPSNLLFLDKRSRSTSSARSLSHDRASSQRSGRSPSPSLSPNCSVSSGFGARRSDIDRDSESGSTGCLSRGRSRSRSCSQSPSRGRSASRNHSRSRSSSLSHKCTLRLRDRSWSRSRKNDRNYEGNFSHNRNHIRNRNRNRSRSRTRSRTCSRSRTPARYENRDRKHGDIDRGRRQNRGYSQDDYYSQHRGFNPRNENEAYRRRKDQQLQQQHYIRNRFQNRNPRPHASHRQRNNQSNSFNSNFDDKFEGSSSNNRYAYLDKRRREESPEAAGSSMNRGEKRKTPSGGGGGGSSSSSSSSSTSNNSRSHGNSQHKEQLEKKTSSSRF